jgi:hypothetical protein
MGKAVDDFVAGKSPLKTNRLQHLSASAVSSQPQSGCFAELVAAGFGT